jgi:ubiquinone biosynthesis UbiH/UbiF/VisC/COQ6 family hydroxylase
MACFGSRLDGGAIKQFARLYCAAFYNHSVKNEICIRGAGVVGQVLALLLARVRIGVTLMQGAPSKQTDLRSFALNAASKQILVDLRLWPDQATPVHHMQVFGDTTGEISFDCEHQPLAWIVDAVDLQERLAAAIGFSPDVKLISHQATPPAAELTIICEGRVSQTREATGATFEQFAYAQSAIAAHVICEKPHHNTAWQWMQTDQICAFLPRGESRNGNSVALVWSVATGRAAKLLSMDRDAFVQQLSQVTRGQLGRLQLTEADSDSGAAPMASWPLVLAQAKQWCGRSDSGAWVLAGDAAHAVHPLAGQGLNLGLGDAAELARALAAKPYFRGVGDQRLLRSYERHRRGEAAMLRIATDGLQRVFASNDGRMLNLRNWGMQGLQSAAPLKAWLMHRASGQR